MMEDGFDNNVVLVASEESFISDSDLQSRLDVRETHLVPSSYSFDQVPVTIFFQCFMSSLTIMSFSLSVCVACFGHDVKVFKVSLGEIVLNMVGG